MAVKLITSYIVIISGIILGACLGAYMMPNIAFINILVDN